MRGVWVLSFALLCAAFVLGQTNRGSISGTVTDSNGAAIPSAKVTVTNTGTNQSVTVTTSEDGNYTVTTLDPVVYRVVAEAVGFKKAIRQGVKVDTASSSSANFRLEIGGVQEEVTISADAPLLNTETGTTTHTITERQLQDVPLNNRSVLDLAVTAPNVSGDAGSEDPEVTSGQPVPGFNLSLNGGRPGSTTILADGVNNTGVGLARSVVSFTPETVQEFTVQTSAYSAEYGQTGGGVINISTKPGSNQFRGTGLIYHRNPYTNAQPYRIGTTPRTPNNLRYTQGSLSFGGPVYLPIKFGEGGKALYDGHNKTFFFFAYEPRYRQDFVTVTTLLPTAAERAGDFRNLTRTAGGWLPTEVATRFNQASTGPANIYQQFTLTNGRLVPITLTGTNQFCQFGDTRAILVNGQPQCTTVTNATPINSLNVLPGNFIDPTAPRILQFMPTGGEYFLDNGVVRNYVVNRSVLQNESRYTLRLDHNFTKSNKANFRYTTTPAIGVRGFGSDVNGNTGVYSDAKQFLLSNTHIFSPRLINELRLSYTRGVFSEDFSPEFSITGGRNLATELGLPSLTAGGLPLFQISGDANIGGYNAFADVGSSGSTNNFNVEERFNIADSMTFITGNRTWKFGVDMNYARLNVIPFFGASGGRWEFRTLNTSSNRSTAAGNGGNNLASLLLGVPNTVQVRPLLLNYDYRWKSGAAYLQHDWKARPNLNINLGFRYALQYPRREKNNLQGAFRTDLSQTVPLTDAQRRATATGLGLATTAAIPDYVPTTVTLPAFAFAGRGGRSQYLVPVDYTGLEPRFGFAWSPKLFKWASDRSAVIRGGFGISHATLTGNNRLPNPDFGAFTGVSTLAGGSTAGGTALSGNPVRLSDNPPIPSGIPIDTVLGTNSDGIVFLNSIGVPGVVVSNDKGAGKVPYSQNWNLSLSFEPFKNTVVEVAYVGNRGTHLYLPLVNINPRSTSFVELLEASNLPSENTFADPLGRRNLLGAVVTVQRSSVTSPFFGFNVLNRYFDPSANSIRHAGYIDVRRRVGRGLTFTANYTYGKSIDDASDSSPDVRVLTSGSTIGQVSLGAPRSSDRAISNFDIKHNLSYTFVWDLPFGKKGKFFKDAPGVVDALVGGWTLSGLGRLQGGGPFLPFITDTNRLGGTNRTVRLNLLNGVPLKNPLYSNSCSVGAGCEPFINPAAFQRPPKGSLGGSPRSLDIRSPMQEYFDLSVQKSFDMPFVGNDGKRRIQLRMDLINAFNHANFRYNNTGNTPIGFGVLPNEAAFTAAEVTSWLAANPGRTATVEQVNGLINSARLPVVSGQTVGAIPLNFFSLPVPQGFATRIPNSFDITTLEGIKLFRLRQSYDANFGTLGAVSNPRYIQIGVRVFF